MVRMSKTVKLKKGLDIRLVGVADQVVVNSELADIYAITLADFHGLTPKMVVKPGDKVKAGTIIFIDKYNEQIKFASPVSGEVSEIVRGDKRRILEVRIKAEKELVYENASAPAIDSMSSDEVKAAVLNAGLWPFFKQRPLDVMANPNTKAKAIFISAFDSSPLAPDYDFIIHGQAEQFQKGIDVLTKLTEGKVHLGLNSETSHDVAFTQVKGVQFNSFSGKHPVGNVGTQIHHVDPINKNEFVWVINAQDVVTIGRYFINGKYDVSKIIALTGSEVKAPKYYRIINGASVKSLLENNLNEGENRIISGNPLTGTKIDENGFIGFYDAQITVLPEGNQPKFFLTSGWLGMGFDKFSNSRLFPTFLTPNKKFRLDTNMNGEDRGFVVTGELEKVFPFDIYPMQLIKAAMTEDIDLMEALGIYEVAPEDFALCEYVCTSKIDIQDEIRKGLDLIKKECF
jgi:Na+-transporting NADH:ubiquinone oxidoreductase subunit A